VRDECGHWSSTFVLAAHAFAYYAKLSAGRQRSIGRATRSRSSTSRRTSTPARASPGSATRSQRDDRAVVQAASQALIDALVAGYRVPKIRVRVLAQRPADETGELHGLYEPEDEGEPARITVWMRTAARRDVVAFKTFLRTLVHELCHHLDYELYKLPNLSHRGVLQTRVDACQRAARAESAQASGS
jgi:hypothetical protein